MPFRPLLGCYATRLNSVEANETFRTLPSQEVFAAWIAATPKQFRFAAEAHRSITHSERRGGTDEGLWDLAASLDPLREVERLGLPLSEPPPSFKANRERLAPFVGLLPRWMQSAIEFRHESWFTNQRYRVLRIANVVLCLAEDDDLAAPPVTTADFHYLRLRKGKFSATARQRIASRLAKLRATSDTSVYFRHQGSPDNPLDAEALLAPKR